MTSPEVLVVEDEKNLRALIHDVLSAGGISVSSAESIAEGESLLAKRAPDLLILDVKLPDGDGIDLLDRVRARGVTVPAIVITAFGTVERAVHAMRAGAFDFIVKPFDNERLKSAVAAVLEAGKKLEELELCAGVVKSESDLSRHLIGATGGLVDVVALLRRVAASDATVLISGESGTGKQVVARAIHDRSARLDGPFVALDCSSIAPTLLESELFGFERGSFTGAHAQRKGHIETAEGGTLFLDEIGDMPLEAQSRLLHVLQEREITRIGGRAPLKVDVRVIAATNRDLAKLVAEGKFRQDLLYRLNVVPIALPPLRERRQDIPGLVDHFLAKHSQRHKVEPPRAPPALIDRLIAHLWPGNVRELENFVERAVVLGYFDERALEAPKPPASSSGPSAPVKDSRVMTLREAIAEAERNAVVAALRSAQGNKAQAARLLGISYKTLFNKIHEHDIREAVSIE